MKYYTCGKYSLHCFLVLLQSFDLLWTWADTFLLLWVNQPVWKLQNLRHWIRKPTKFRDYIDHCCWILTIFFINVSRSIHNRHQWNDESTDQEEWTVDKSFLLRLEEVCNYPVTKRNLVGFLSENCWSSWWACFGTVEAVSATGK